MGLSSPVGLDPSFLVKETEEQRRILRKKSLSSTDQGTDS